MCLNGRALLNSLRLSVDAAAYDLSVYCAPRADLEWKASLAGARVATRLRNRRVVRLDRHVLCQPVEYVGSMPSDWFATVGSPLRKLTERRQSQQ